MRAKIRAKGEGLTILEKEDILDLICVFFCLFSQICCSFHHCRGCWVGLREVERILIKGSKKR